MRVQRRGAVFSWRRRVPQKVVAIWGRREVVRSLRTTDRDVASRDARRLSVTADRFFDHIRTVPGRHWFAEAMERDEEARVSSGAYRPIYRLDCDEHEDPVEADLDILDHLMSDYREALSYNDFNLVRRDVEGILIDAGVTPDRKSETFRRLARALLRAHVEVLSLSKARRVGDYAAEPTDPLFRARPVTAQAVVPLAPLHRLRPWTS